MGERRVINGVGYIAPALVNKLFSRSAWVAPYSHNVFKAEKDISINAIADKDWDTIKHSNKLEIYYSLVITWEIYARPQLTIHTTVNRGPHHVEPN